MGPLDQVLPAHPVLSQHIKLASDDWYVGKSEVAGQGVFAGKDYESGDRIGLAMTDGGENEFSAKIWNLTELARYCNHQNKNNVDIEKDGDRFHLVAIKPIGQDEELVSNYWQVARAKGPHSVMLYEGKQVPTSDLSDYVEKEATDAYEGSYLSTLAPKWSDKSHIVAALRDHLTDASGALDTDLEAKEMADLSLIAEAYRRAHVTQELMDERKAKFKQYAASPSLGTVDDVYVQSAVPAASRDLQKESEYRLEDQTFSDSDGAYNVADLYELAKAKGKPQNLQISDLLHNLEPSPEEEGEELPGHPDFVSRAEAAGDLPGVVVNYPDGKWVADGVHRLWKANRDKKREFPAYMLEQSDLAGLLQKEAAEDLQGFMDRAELMGSRGRALKYGRPEPEGRDYDRVVFTDDAEDQQALMKNLREVAKIKGYKQHERPEGFLTISGDNQDLSVYPTSKRDKIYNAWKLIEGGMSKDEAWDQIAKEAKDKEEFVHSCCGEPSGKCAGCSEGSVLIPKDEYEKVGDRSSRDKADS